MTIFAKLALGFGAVLVMLGASGAVTLRNLSQLREADDHVRERVSFNELALQYRHAAMDATLGASQLAAGNVMGDQRIREGMAAMAQSRKRLEERTVEKEARRELAEIVRVEKLTASSILRVAALVKAKQPAMLVQQELASLSARSDALDLGLEGLFEDSREAVAASLEGAQQLGALVQQQTSYAVALCVVLALLVTAWILRAIAGPIARLDAGVRQVTAGHLDHVIPVTSSGELGALTQAFNEITARLHTATSALDGRNEDMRVVLDHVHQGLLTMRRDGTTLAERSAMVETLLGHISPDVTLWNALRREDSDFATALRVGFEAVIEATLPLEVTLAQMPKLLKRRGRHLEFEYRPILEGETLAKLLVVISDASDRVAREEASAHEREVMAIFKAMQRDKQGFLDFVKEGSALMGALSADGAHADQVTLKRHLHTLKGNSGSFAIQSIATTCHELETALAAADRAASAPLWLTLKKRWAELGEVISSLSGDAKARIEIDDDDYTAILDAILQGRPRGEIARMVANWRMERVDHRLLRLGDQARGLAQRLGKGELQVVVEANGVRLPRESFYSFWGSLVHAIRNAVDHGVETAEQRAAQRKSEPPTLTLRAAYLGDELIVSVVDDGRGIDWTRIADKARQLGMPAETQDDLVEALFSDGLSTSDGVSDVAGRGVGMSALRAACSHLAGRIVIDSRLGDGTSMSFHFPIDVTRDAAVIEVASRIPLESFAPRARTEAALEG